jgi:hypothetical protein
MKGIVALCLSVCLHAYASEEINQAQSIGLKMIEAAKSAAGNFVNNKKSIGTLLDIFKDSDIYLQNIVEQSILFYEHSCNQNIS